MHRDVICQIKLFHSSGSNRAYNSLTVTTAHAVMRIQSVGFSYKQLEEMFLQIFNGFILKVES